MKTILLAATILAAIPITPAKARLQMTIDVNGTDVLTCYVGKAGCGPGRFGGETAFSFIGQFGGAAFNIQADQDFGGSIIPPRNAGMDMGTSTLTDGPTITNQSGAPMEISITLGITDVVSNNSPTNSMQESASGAGLFSFWADPTDVQGADLFNTPGTLLFQEDNTGFEQSWFDGRGRLTSLTEQAIFQLGIGESVNFGMDMHAIVPEPSTWAMMGIGFAAMALLGARKRSLLT